MGVHRSCTSFWKKRHLQPPGSVAERRDAGPQQDGQDRFLSRQEPTEGQGRPGGTQRLCTKSRSAPAAPSGSAGQPKHASSTFLPGVKSRAVQAHPQPRELGLQAAGEPVGPHGVHAAVAHKQVELVTGPQRDARAPTSPGAGTHVRAAPGLPLVPEKRSYPGCRRWRRDGRTVQTDNGQPSAEVQPQTSRQRSAREDTNHPNLPGGAVTARLPLPTWDPPEEATGASLTRPEDTASQRPLPLWGLPSGLHRTPGRDPAPAHPGGLLPAAPTQGLLGTCTGHLAPKGLGLTEAKTFWVPCVHVSSGTGAWTSVPSQTSCAEILTPW